MTTSRDLLTVGGASFFTGTAGDDDGPASLSSSSLSTIRLLLADTLGFLLRGFSSSLLLSTTRFAVPPPPPPFGLAPLALRARGISSSSLSSGRPRGPPLTTSGARDARVDAEDPRLGATTAMGSGADIAARE